MSIRPGNIGSIKINTGVGTAVSETYNPHTKAEYGRGGSVGLAYGGTYDTATTPTEPEARPPPKL